MTCRRWNPLANFNQPICIQDQDAPASLSSIEYAKCWLIDVHLYHLTVPFLHKYTSLEAVLVGYVRSCLTNVFVFASLHPHPSAAATKMFWRQKSVALNWICCGASSSWTAGNWWQVHIKVKWSLPWGLKLKLKLKVWVGTIDVKCWFTDMVHIWQRTNNSYMLSRHYYVSLSSSVWFVGDGNSIEALNLQYSR